MKQVHVYETDSGSMILFRNVYGNNYLLNVVNSYKEWNDENAPSGYDYFPPLSLTNFYLVGVWFKCLIFGSSSPLKPMYEWTFCSATAYLSFNWHISCQTWHIIFFTVLAGTVQV